MFLILSVVILNFTFLNQVEAINGGKEVTDLGNLNYQVGILIEKPCILPKCVQPPEKSLCGGGIINKDLILTSAHCFAKEELNKDGSVKSVKYEKVKVHINVGTVNLKTKQHATEVKATHVYFPKDYFKKGDDDIAILKLEKSLNLHHLGLEELKLPEKSKIDGKIQFNNYIGFIATLAGFGEDLQHKSDKILKKMSAKVTDIGYCQKAYKRDSLHSRNICGLSVDPATKKHPGTPLGACSGDSGSPLVIDDGTVIGVLMTNSAECNDELDTPGVYIRVSKYVTFINQVIDDHVDGTIKKEKLDK